MNRRTGIITAALVLLLLAGCATAFLHYFKPVTSTIRLPPKGEAAYNPLYALDKTLQAHGATSHAYPSLNPALALGRRDTLLLYTRPEALTAAQSNRLVAWVRQGGHLVMPGPESAADPGPLATAVGLRARFNELDENVSDDELGGQLACTPVSRRPTDASAPATPAAGRVETAGNAKAGLPVRQFCGTPFVTTQPGFRLGDGDPQRGWRFARRDFGAGVVTVMQLDFLDNALLEGPVSRDLAFQLLAPRLGQGQFHLVYSADVPSLWRLLLAHGWPVLLPLLLAMCAWLACRSQRFGPVLPVASPNRRALLEHVQAAGEFAFRRGRGVALHSALLAWFQRRLAQRDPALAALDGEALVLALSMRMALDPQRIRQALRPIALQRGEVFTQSMSTLVLMRNRL